MTMVSEPGASQADHQYMARAIHLAGRGLYTTDPNPRVGCVLVKNNQVVAEGLHRRAGEAHAEANALAEAGDAARGATAYVSLEPCSHQGRTPPCADSLIHAGVSRVVAAMQDPNPLVAGQGLARLRQAGIAVHCGLLEAQASRLNPGFIKRMRQGLPYVRCKLAMSLDGRTAMASGESQWITGDEARHDVQRYRARSSAIVTGIGTVRADDPSLNVRLGAGDLHDLGDAYAPLQPLRVVLDTNLRMSGQARMLALPGQTLILTAKDCPESLEPLQRAGAILQQVEAGEAGLNLTAVLRELALRDINEVWIEAGATLSGAFVAAGLVDELILYLAPHLMGDHARGLLRLPGIECMADRIPLRLDDVRQVGDDLRLTLTPSKP
jgi:diaminohydroxyphosphoribosylaminopyrimidine deaminase/5-amino-6-(5-phosphoribosylamino)uracil reductase